MPDKIKTQQLPPLSTIGIIGGGQLGRMMAISAAQMGYQVHIFSPEQDSPAGEVAKFTTIAAYDDEKALSEFAGKVDVVTYEFENISVAPLEKISKLVPIFPSPRILAISQHRVQEKQAVNNMKIATAPFAAVSSVDELQKAIDKISLPAVLKTCRMGYDGKGQIILKNISDLQNGIDFCTRNSKGEICDLILEGFVDFTMEISVIVARDIAGNTLCYCPVQNIHKNHILAETIAPAPINSELANKAENIAVRIAENFNLIGLIAIEMFVTRDNEILVNEIAPRPHNSGHWTIDACITSQFEQSIRAACGLPLGSPQRLCDARMLNLIGDDINKWSEYFDQPNAKLHLYGKKETKSGRKMGHVTFVKI